MKCIFQILMIAVSIETVMAPFGSEISDIGFSAIFLKSVSPVRKAVNVSPTANDAAAYLDLTSPEIFKLVGLIGFCCITVVVVVSRYRKNLKSDRMQYEAEIHKTQLKLAALKEKQVLLAEEFELSSIRLREVAEHLENKRQILANIKQLVELTSSEQLINSETKSKFSKIGRNIQYSFHVDQEWYHFRSYFENANEKFLANLKERFPALSPNDYKLCVLYKTDSDHERVASIMEISPESARVMKHRLKKKLELPLNACLSEFLRSFDTETTKSQSHLVS